MLRIRHQFTIISLGCLALCTIILSPVSGDSKDDASPPSKEVKAQIREMLSEFNSLIGGWRGAGQVRRGSTAGAWQEEGRFVWKFDGGNVGIEYRLADGKHLKSGVLSWDPKTKDFTFQAERPDGARSNVEAVVTHDASCIRWCRPAPRCGLTNSGASAVDAGETTFPDNTALAAVLVVR